MVTRGNGDTWQARGICFINIRRNAIPEEEHSFLARCALKLQRRVYAPKERIVPDELQIVVRGVVGQNGNILRQGAVRAISSLDAPYHPTDDVA